MITRYASFNSVTCASSRSSMLMTFAAGVQLSSSRPLGGMLAVEAEIKWALDKMKAKEGRTFAEAYLPFTSLGQITVQWLMSSQKWDAEQAWSHVVDNPHLVDRRF